MDREAPPAAPRLLAQAGRWRDYEAFGTKAQAQEFIGLCNKFGRDKVVARHRMPALEQAPTMVSAPATQVAHTITVPALAAGLTAPTPAGITLAWLGEQYVSSGNKGNELTRNDYTRDLARYVYPFFTRKSAGDVDISLIMTRPLPTLDRADWPWPTVATWHDWLGEQPRHDRRGEPITGTLLKDKTRRNLESLLSQVFNFALAYDPMPLLNRNPCTSLGLIRPEPEECVILEFSAAQLLLKHLDPWFVLLVTFLLATGIRWGEAAALQVKDIHLGDGSEADPPWVLVHKTWKRIGFGPRTGHGWRSSTGSRNDAFTPAWAGTLRPVPRPVSARAHSYPAHHPWGRHRAGVLRGVRAAAVQRPGGPAAGATKPCQVVPVTFR